MLQYIIYVAIKEADMTYPRSKISIVMLLFVVMICINVAADPKIIAPPSVECNSQAGTCTFKNLAVLNRRHPEQTKYAVLHCVADKNTRFVMMRNHCALMKGFSYFASGMTGYILFHQDFTADDNNYGDAFHPLSELNNSYFQAVEDDTKYHRTCEDSRIDFISDPAGSVKCQAGPDPKKPRTPLKGMFG